MQNDWFSRSDRSAHGLVRNAKEASGNLLDSELLVLSRVDFLSQLGKQSLAVLDIERLVFVGAKDLRAALVSR